MIREELREGSSSTKLKKKGAGEGVWMRKQARWKKRESVCTLTADLQTKYCCLKEKRTSSMCLWKCKRRKQVSAIGQGEAV